jgi:hypothetical protein
MANINGHDGSVDVAIGVVAGQVVLQWKDPITEIVFDPKNAWAIGVAISKAAMEAHRGYPSDSADLKFIADEMATQKVKISDAQRDKLIGKVATQVRTLLLQNRTPGYIAMDAVDTVLAETAQ